jgi:uncharacterized protein YbjT (DUF2867 family)
MTYDMRDQTIAIFGGSGFLGSYVIQNLVKRGARLRVISRALCDTRPLVSMGSVGQVAPIQLPSLSRDSVLKVLEGCTGCVNLIGILYESKKQTFDLIHKDVPTLIGTCAQELEMASVVHVSALGADKNSTSSYAKSKALGEEGLKAAFPGATILRPSLVFGPEDHFFNRFAHMAQLFPVLCIIRGSAVFQPVYVGDIAQATELCLMDPHHKGKTYELGGSDLYTFRELIELMLYYCHRKAVVISLPTSLGMVIGALGELFPVPPLTKDQVRLLAKDTCVSEAALSFKDLGISATPLEAILPSYLERFRPAL